MNSGKINILVFGITSRFGGTESYLRSLISNIDRSSYNFDFMIIGEKKAILEEEMNTLINDGKNHFFYPPNMKKNYMKTKKWLKNFYENHDYDIIYMNVTSAARIVYCDYAIRNKNVKLITHNHCGNSINKKAGINNSLFKRYTTRKSDLRLACSDAAYYWGFSNVAGQPKIIKNGINLDKYQFESFYREEIRNSYGIDNDKIVIGHVGRFSIEKNHKFFVSLSKVLGEKYIFLCAGEGDTKKELLDLVKQEGVSNQFRILGFRHDTQKLYSAMDIFMMPSLYEGLPIVCVEAQANGLPCVFSDTISKQSDICGHSVFLSLQNLACWVDYIKKMEIRRYDNKKKLMEAGYDIKKTASEMDLLFKSLKERNE